MKFQIHGMDCAEEVAVLKREVGPLVSGEANLSFDILNGVMTVQARSSIMPIDVIVAVERTGMRAEPWHEAREISSGGFWSRHGRVALTAASGVLTPIR